MIDFTLTSEQEQLRRSAINDAAVSRQFAARADRERLIQEPVVEILSAWSRLPLPKEHGGKDADLMTCGLVLTELAAGDPAPPLWLSMHYFALREAMRPEVSPRARKHVFDVVASGCLFSAAISEGRSTGHLPLTYIPRDVRVRWEPNGMLRINGTKRFVTGFRQSDWIMFYALVDNPEYTGDPEGTVACLMLPSRHQQLANAEGNEWGNANFMRSSNTNSVTFRDVVVGEDAVLFKTSNFLDGAVFQYGASTFSYMAVYPGIYREAISVATELLRGRRVAGKEQSAAYFPGVVNGMGQCRFWGEAADALLLQSLWSYKNRYRDAESGQRAVIDMLAAKVAVGRLLDNGMTTLRNQVMTHGLLDPRMQRCFDNMQPAGFMPPTRHEAENLLGAFTLGVNPLEIPTIS